MRPIWEYNALEVSMFARLGLNAAATRWVVGLTVVVCFLSWIHHFPEEMGPVLASPPTKASVATPSTVSRVLKSTVRPCGATLAEYMALQVGMTLDDANRTIGCRGTEVSRVSLDGYETAIVSWPGESGGISNMNATFDNGRLTGRAQLALR
jgi:hypothetical protein